MPYPSPPPLSSSPIHCGPSFTLLRSHPFKTRHGATGAFKTSLVGSTVKIYTAKNDLVIMSHRNASVDKKITGPIIKLQELPDEVHCTGGKSETSHNPAQLTRGKRFPITVVTPGSAPSNRCLTWLSTIKQVSLTWLGAVKQVSLTWLGTTKQLSCLARHRQTDVLPGSATSNR